MKCLSLGISSHWEREQVVAGLRVFMYIVFTLPMPACEKLNRKKKGPQVNPELFFKRPRGPERRGIRRPGSGSRSMRNC